MPKSHGCKAHVKALGINGESVQISCNNCHTYGCLSQINHPTVAQNEVYSSRKSIPSGNKKLNQIFICGE